MPTLSVTASALINATVLSAELYHEKSPLEPVVIEPELRKKETGLLFKIPTSPLKVAAPPADISRVRAVIALAPSIPVKNISLSAIVEPIIRSDPPPLLTCPNVVPAS